MIRPIKTGSKIIPPRELTFTFLVDNQHRDSLSADTLVDELIFVHSAFPRYVEWIYLLTGIRLLSTLLLGAGGAIGLLISGLIVDFLHDFPHDPVRATATPPSRLKPQLPVT